MKITVDDVLNSFGASSLSNECMKFLASSDFVYEILIGDEKETMILDSLKKIEEDRQIIGASERTDVWHNGWKENLNAFRKSGNLSDIVPKFIRPNNVVRFNQNFIRPHNPYFEKDYCCLFQKWLFEHYMEPFDTVYEFGCGSGFNLVSMSYMFPDKMLVGTDFVHSSVDLINEIAQKNNLNMKGYFFDMLHPDMDFSINSNSCVFTFGAIEQLASKFQKFIDYLISKNVKRCIHIEPTIELYDSDNIVDYLAIMFHRKRGYSEGLLPYLKNLHDYGVINFVKANRLRFGNDCMEGYNYLVWDM